MTAASSVGEYIIPVLRVFGAVQRGIQRNLECLNELSGPKLETRRARARLEMLSSQLETRRVVFASELQGLLSIIYTEEDCNEMVKNPDHLGWKNRLLDEEIRNRFGESFGTWISRLRLIDGIMRTILDEILEPKDQSDAKGLNCKKLRESAGIFSDISWITGMQRNVQVLKDLIEDFYIVSGQVRRSASEVTEQRSWTNINFPSTSFYSSSHHSFITSKVLEWRDNVAAPYLVDSRKTRIGAVRRASQQLYHALSRAWSCKIHEIHYGTICLDIEDKMQGRQPEIEFTLALTSKKWGTSAFAESMWLTVECGIRDARQLVDMAGSVNDMPHLPWDSTSGPDKKGWRDFSWPIELGDIIASPVSGSPAPLEDMMVASRKSDSSRRDQSENSEDIQDVCSELRQRRNATKSLLAEMCLQQANRLKERACRSNEPSSYSRSTLSLQEALSTTRISQGNISTKEKLRIANTLAIAMLEFHSTPWLRETWGSGDVLFYKEDGLLGTPFLKAPLVEDPRKDDLYNEHCDKKELRTGIRNGYIYGLGIVLLELGFGAPLRSLRRDLDEEGTQIGKTTDDRIADRLKYLVSKQLGARYGKVVRKCLDCDFGSGYELDNMELRNAVFNQVVEELDRCSKAASIA